MCCLLQLPHYQQVSPGREIGLRSILPDEGWPNSPPVVCERQGFAPFRAVITVARDLAASAEGEPRGHPQGATEGPRVAAATERTNGPRQGGNGRYNVGVTS